MKISSDIYQKELKKISTLTGLEPVHEIVKDF